MSNIFICVPRKALGLVQVPLGSATLGWRNWKGAEGFAYASPIKGILAAAVMVFNYGLFGYMRALRGGVWQTFSLSQTTPKAKMKNSLALGWMLQPAAYVWQIIYSYDKIMLKTSPHV